MTDEDLSDTTAADTRAEPVTAGSVLRAARESAGLTVMDVAQQLKLAPRQVKAIEDDDFARLPGRTFARGFARNYARFLQLDADAVVALMPASESAPALERSAIVSSRRPMGEIPDERATKRAPASRRLALLVVLLALAAAAAFYEYAQQAEGRRGFLPFRMPGVKDSPATAPGTITPPAAPAGVTTLPNPVADAALPQPEPSSRGAATVAVPPAPAPAAADNAAPGSASETPLVLTFNGTSWAEVKDATGRVILQMTGGPGKTETVSGRAPLELSLGNAPAVDVTFRGRSLGLGPYTRGVVARVSLK